MGSGNQFKQEEEGSRETNQHLHSGSTGRTDKAIQREQERQRHSHYPMRGVNIIQYNCGGANGRKARPFLDSLDPKEHPVIAIKEPMIPEKTKTIYCPRNYRLSRQVQPG